MRCLSQSVLRPLRRPKHTRPQRARDSTTDFLQGSSMMPGGAWSRRRPRSPIPAPHADRCDRQHEQYPAAAQSRAAVAGARRFDEPRPGQAPVIERAIVDLDPKPWTRGLPFPWLDGRRRRIVSAARRRAVGGRARRAEGARTAAETGAPDVVYMKRSSGIWKPRPAPKQGQTADAAGARHDTVRPRRQRRSTRSGDCGAAPGARRADSSCVKADREKRLRTSSGYSGPYRGRSAVAAEFTAITRDYETIQRAIRVS